MFNRSTQKAERRYYDFKGNIIDKPEYGGGTKSNGNGQVNGQSNGPKSSGGEVSGDSFGAGGKKVVPDTRPEYKVTAVM